MDHAGIEGWTAQRYEYGRLDYSYGALNNRHSFRITFRFLKDDPRVQEWIDSILASVEWK